MVAEQEPKPDQNQRRQGTNVKGKRSPVPNRIAYKDTAFKDWQPGMKVPVCRVCQGLLPPRENHECPGYYPKYPGIRSDIPFEERKAMREAARDDWDDDQYDRTTPGDIPVNPDEEDSGTV